MQLPRLFLELHGGQLFKLFQQYGEVVQIAPREPLGDISEPPPEFMTVVTVRCINDRGTVRFEALTTGDQKAAEDWAEKHKRTTREQFDWLPFTPH